MTYKIYKTDHTMTVEGGGWTAARWQDIANNMSTNSRQPAGYAVYRAQMNAEREIILVSVEQGRNVHDHAYKTVEIEDIDSRIERALKAIDDAIEARAAKIAAQGNVTTFQCVEQGCQARVDTRGTRCARCQHDA